MSTMPYSRVSLMLHLMVGCSLCAQPPAPPASPQNRMAEALQGMFEQFSQQAGPLSPMFGPLSADQQQAIDRIEISPAEELRFGRQVLKAYLDRLRSMQIGVTRRGRDAEYIQALLSALKPFMNQADRYRNFETVIIDAPSTDAYSIPGGHILITRGLLEQCESEAAVVGVLAHELSHLDRGHQLLGLKQTKLAKQALNFNDGMLLIGLVARPLRPEFEQQADRDATQWMMRAGYQPIELARLLTQWDQRQNGKAPWLDFVPNFVKSHPDPGQRAGEITETAAQLAPQYPQATYVGAKNLALRIPRSKRDLP